MTNQFSIKAIIGVILMIFSFAANAQNFIEVAEEAKEYVLIKTENKESYVGYIADETKATFTIQTDEGNIIFVEKSTIKKQLSIDKANIVNGEYWAPNPSTNIVTSNAFGLKKGEGFYQNNAVIINSVGYGLTDNVSISAGLESISLLTNNGAPTFFVSGKYTKPVAEKISVGGSAALIKTPAGLGEGLNGSAVGLVTGLVTYGDRNRNMTAGIRYAIGANDTSKPIFSLASQFRVSKRFALLGDILIVPNVEGINSNKTRAQSLIGLRFLGDNVIVDGSIIIIQELNIGIPMMSVRIPFGNRS